MSADGGVFVFESDASNLVAPALVEDEPETTDVFARYSFLGLTVPMSLNKEWSAMGNGSSVGTAVSADGRFAAFQSEASDLIYRDLNATRDVFGVSLVGEPMFVVTAYSPVDIVVTSSQGDIVSKTVNQIPTAQYLEQDFDGDGEMDDRVIISDPMTGGYTVQVVPETGADPNTEVTLIVQDRGRTTTVIDAVPVIELPVEPIDVWVDRSPPSFVVEADPNILFPAETYVPVHAHVVRLEDETDPAPQVTLASIRPSWLDSPGTPLVRDAEYATDDREFELLSARGAQERYYTATYAATDASGNVTKASFIVSVGNQKPVAEAGPDQTVQLGEPVLFDGASSNDADGDPLTFAWDFGDGKTGSGATAAHTYSKPGIYTVTLAVNDGYFGGTDDDTLTIHVAGTSLADGDLYVVGTPTNDHVFVGRLCSHIFVTGDFLPGCCKTKSFAASDVERILIELAGGDDDAVIAWNVDRPAKIDGGPGDDRLKGSWREDILLGGDGDDYLNGSGGPDILIGGSGADVILGRSGDDILIAGTTAWDAHNAALLAILAEWASDRDFETRMKNIRGINNPEFGDRLNRGTADYFLSLDGGGEAEIPTVFDDSDIDVLIGGFGRDWYLANIHDGEDDSDVLDLLIDLTTLDYGDDLEFLLPGVEE
jgi:PKD repeat protein